MSPSPAVGRTSAMDRALLRRFEPVIRYTRGERFFPMRVEPYIAECSLWQQKPGREAELLVPERELSLALLAEPRQAPATGAKHLSRLAVRQICLQLLQAIRCQFGEIQRRDELQEVYCPELRLARLC